ncbi:MAG: hypothetical protein AAF391_11550 [Bacteroidota bacterium]
MKRNIIIVFLLLTTLVFIVFAFIKADEASKLRVIAEQERAAAEELRDEAVSLRDIAQQRAADAIRERSRAEDLAVQLQECKTQ